MDGGCADRRRRLFASDARDQGLETRDWRLVTRYQDRGTGRHAYCWPYALRRRDPGPTL